MKYWLIVSLLFVFVVTVPAFAGAVEPTETMQLFDGKSLDGFYTWMAGTGREDVNRVFSVVDAIDGAPAIRVSGQGYGAFITEKEYKNYHLTVEFRWGLLTWGNRKDAARDSGILVHCQGPDGNTGKDFKGPWMQSIETQIIEGGVADIILVAGWDAEGNRLKPVATSTVTKDRDGEMVYSPDGETVTLDSGRINWSGRDPDWDGSLGYVGKDDVEGHGAEWTTLEVICDGDVITNIVNGHVVSKVWDTSLTEGKIIFQTEGAELYFRKIELKPVK